MCPWAWSYDLIVLGLQYALNLTYWLNFENILIYQFFLIDRIQILIAVQVRIFIKDHHLKIIIPIIINEILRLYSEGLIGNNWIMILLNTTYPYFAFDSLVKLKLEHSHSLINLGRVGVRNMMISSIGKKCY